MSTLLILAIISITLALVFYTIGVWSENKAGVLKKQHLYMFYLGLIFDTLGTTLMSKIAGEFSFNLHAITGMLAIVLMLIHAIWGTYVFNSNNEHLKEKFHKFSIIVWGIWLIPYFIGMLVGMGVIG